VGPVSQHEWHYEGSGEVYDMLWDLMYVGSREKHFGNRGWLLYTSAMMISQQQQGLPRSPRPSYLLKLVSAAAATLWPLQAFSDPSRAAMMHIRSDLCSLLLVSSLCRLSVTHLVAAIMRGQRTLEMTCLLLLLLLV
jgi:hypothetical protein